ncbi:MAG: aspartate--tRNA(Asn) ligase [Clostridia bacterium]|nr:aspartate--tRNA(Asn) ligase [Clostridia bacterium]MBQ8583903.1 aspartate--tRNA(Asn) ligase [Clostridia bacterium]
MERTYIKDVTPGYCRVQGFVENFRNKRTMAFIVVKDITGKLQVTIEKEKHPELLEMLDRLTIHSVVTFEGEVVASEYVKMGGKEMYPSVMRIESVAEALPIKDDSEIDVKMDYRWIDLRREKNQLMIAVQTTLTAAMREFLVERNFVEIHTPKLIAAASESGSDVFEVKYFDTKAYLAQSPQFYKQMAMASGLERIFETGPVFRAEKSYTNKHATEFTGFDLEFSYIDSFEDVMKMEEELLTYALAKVKEAHGDKIVELYGEEYEVIVPTLPFPRMKLADVYRELEERYGYTVPDELKGDLTTEAERMTKQLCRDKFGHEFLFITDYNAAERAFYHMRDENGIPQGYDLIWRGVEITTGAQREHRYDVLKAQAEEKGLADDVKFYLEFFKYGCPPHGGFGIGIDRLTMLFLGLSIKEVQFLFRGPNRLTP